MPSSTTTLILNGAFLTMLILSYQFAGLVFDGEPGENIVRNLASLIFSAFALVLAFIAWGDAPRSLRSLHVLGSLLALLLLAAAANVLFGPF